MSSIPYDKWMTKIVAYALANYTQEQVERATYWQVKNLLGNLEGHGFTDEMFNKIKRDALEAFDHRSQNQQLAAIKARLISHYPNAEFTRDTEWGKRVWKIWPDGQPVFEDS